jgi:hypothetical protein
MQLLPQEGGGCLVNHFLKFLEEFFKEENYFWMDKLSCFCLVENFNLEVGKERMKIV